ncbi:helix-turn-helix transcriptional regulator [Rhizobium sp. BG4]|uniref:ArsR/SmtB family transcription factor n=1 Tax=Rhizobium sp. BG4 TaxID=2613770 RepID=UPI00193D8194|nr:helix-turn-helix transcriptional regulator [Rhizobium sp. BG4]QRM45131.1 helix-turn-helix transcriptional regulator [Rhizobium sp. BG4]
MNDHQALLSFAALSQATRLAVVRALVVVGPDGLPAGIIADQMGVSPSNISFHLKELERSGLVVQRRVSRSLIYAANFDALADLIKFLMEDCCSGHPRICSSVEQSDDCSALTEDANLA